MRNTFNNLLMVLACLDSAFLILAMLDYSIARGRHQHHHNHCHHSVINIIIITMTTMIVIIIICSV